MLVYPSGIDLSGSALQLLSSLLRTQCLERDTRWRRLPAGRQALLVLAHLRCGHTYAQLAAGFGVGITTAYRYVTEAVEILKALAPDITTAVRAAAHKAYLILDGTLLPIDRIAADRPYYSGKHRRHGMNVQVLTDPSALAEYRQCECQPAVQPARPGRVRPDGLVRVARGQGDFRLAGPPCHRLALVRAAVAALGAAEDQ